MKLIETLVAIVMISIFSSVFAGLLSPTVKIYTEASRLKAELDANRFISKSFCALTARDVDFDAWCSLVNSVTGCSVTVTKVYSENTNAFRGDISPAIYRAAWSYNEKPLFIDAEFNL